MINRDARLPVTRQGALLGPSPIIRGPRVGSHDFQLFIDAYKHARSLKTLHWLKAYEYVGKIWTQEMERFERNTYRTSRD